MMTGDGGGAQVRIHMWKSCERIEGKIWLCVRIGVDMRWLLWEAARLEHALVLPN